MIKELTDNALDAGSRVQAGSIACGYYVEDDGPGLDPDEVARLFSIGRPLMSTKLLRLPTRGALGNGLRVVAGAVLASDGFLIVETSGVRLRLKPQRDGYTQVVERTASTRRIGIRIEIGFGPDLPADPNALLWGQLAIHLARGPSYAGQSSPWWYDVSQFHELLSASGSATVRALVANFDGCAGASGGRNRRHGWAKPDHRPGPRSRPSPSAPRDGARGLSKPVNPKRLGAIGPEAFPDRAYAIARGAGRVRLLSAGRYSGRRRGVGASSGG